MNAVQSQSKKRAIKAAMLAVKIAVGSSAAIYLSELLNLNFASSAGTITLLTLMTTKWETVKLSIWRLVTFCAAILLGCVLFSHLQSQWIAFGVYVFLVTFFSDFLGWRATISVNAVVGVHLLELRDFSLAAVENELKLVLIGIGLALLLNLFHGNLSRKKELAKGMRDTETRLKSGLLELAEYLKDPDNMDTQVWLDISNLKKSIQGLVQDAYEYQENTFQDMSYYYLYLEMRLEQCNILNNLQSELRKIRSRPVQAEVIADYMTYMAEYVAELHRPRPQLKRLRELFTDLEQGPLPADRREFESRAILYHVLMDLEDYLLIKERFLVAQGTEDRSSALSARWN